MKLYKFYETEPLFKQREFSSLDEERRITTLRVYKILQSKIIPVHDPNMSAEIVRKINILPRIVRILKIVSMIYMYIPSPISVDITSLAQ